MSTELHGQSATLPSNEVHLWFLTDALPFIGTICADGFILLSPGERHRFVKMKNRTMARRYLLGRILLRRVLALYLNTDPVALAFRYNANGKPALDGPQAGPLSFNLSHSATELVLAVAHASAIGVDIEAIDRVDAAYRISQRFYSTGEIRDLEAQGTRAPERALVLWALKESIIKANGDTVWDGLAKLALAIEGCQITWSLPDADIGQNWQLAAGSVREDYILACAIRASGAKFEEPIRFRTRRLEGDPKEKHSFQPGFST